MDFASRAARNEEIFRGVNEQIDEGAQLHGVTGSTAFHCECGSTSCFETVSLAPATYNRIADLRYHFVVFPGHEIRAVERVVETYPGYLVVEKIGEAREQIDRDHPQERHRP